MVSSESRQFVRHRAKFRCEYCHSPEYLSADRFHIDHVLPRSLAGSDDLENLALACSRCNQRRSNAVIGIDPESQTEAALFNPRQDDWRSHFIWTADSLKIIGQSAIGRATMQRLDLNDERYPGEDSIRQARWFWNQGGWHPPEGDPVMAASSDHESEDFLFLP